MSAFVFDLPTRRRPHLHRSGHVTNKVASQEFNDTVETLQQVVPVVKADGADVVIVLAHTGEDPTDYVWNPADLQENAARSIAQNVSGIDVIVAGHSHVTNLEQKYYTNPDGREVLLTQPGYHARALSKVNIPLSLQDGDVVVDWTDEVKPSASHLAAPGFAQDLEIENVIAPWFEETKDWVGTVVAQSTEEMKSETSAWEDTAILDFNNYRQSGGSAYPHVKTAPVIYDEQKAICDLMIEWAQENGTIDPSTFFEKTGPFPLPLPRAVLRNLPRRRPTVKVATSPRPVQVTSSRSQAQHLRC
nr:CapA family protein [Actinomyces sp. S4-C9]